jgi:predicted acylesterase/phospholipase RssA
MKALALAGGNALGSYLAGAYEALHDAGEEPDWIVGTSIGAITGGMIAGNPPERQVARLRRYCMDPPRLLARVLSLQDDRRSQPEARPCRSNSTPNTAIISRSRAIGSPTGRTMTPRCASGAI